jgi:hypothetical protein
MAKEKKPVGKAQSPSEAKAKQKSIDKITEDVWEMLIEGKTYRSIAQHFDVKLSTLADYLAKSEHSARRRECLIISADIFADLAEEAFKSISDEAQNGEIMRQRELGQFYKWKSAKRNPRIYSDKMEVEQDTQSATPPPSIHVHIGNDVVKKAENL